MFCCCAEEDTKNVAQIIDTAPVLQDHPRAASPEPTSVEEDSDVCFVAKLSRRDAEEPLGLKADFADEKMIHVCRVIAEGDTAISRYNASVAESKKIKVGDYIAAVNGVYFETVLSDKKVSEVLRDQLVSSSSVEITVRRPEVFECKIEKNGKQVGLELSYNRHGFSLIVQKINDGAARSSAPEVKEGDRIVAVGSVEGPPETLLDAIRNASDTLHLKMSRPLPLP